MKIKDFLQLLSIEYNAEDIRTAAIKILQKVDRIQVAELVADMNELNHINGEVLDKELIEFAEWLARNGYSADEDEQGIIWTPSEHQRPRTTKETLQLFRNKVNNK
ncbi:MAG TPA: hypothetical protein VGZ90_13545 [Puia sp.]|jgi:hypothetical protein|nr:hypothetical protein [Puia sp.]